MDDAESRTPDMILCDCNEVAVMRTSWTEANPGRRFWGCPRFQKGEHCNFFQWYESPTNPAIVEKLNRLNSDIEDLRSEKKKMKKKLIAALIFGFGVGLGLSAVGRKGISEALFGSTLLA